MPSADSFAFTLLPYLGFWGALVYRRCSSPRSATSSSDCSSAGCITGTRSTACC
ncbi:MAG: hypothetical protein WDN49_10825 [Acetobacteraceae bacterium]